jgi:hypothetical protein
MEAKDIYISLIILSNIPYQGGGAIIGVLMIQALKGAFMGYIGLLLNDPYNRDRMMGCVCGLGSFS